MKNRIKYTPEEEKQICFSYERNISIDTICSEFGFTSPKLYAILRRNNVKLRGNPNKIPLEIEKTICHMSLNPETTCQMIMDSTGISKSSIVLILRKNNLSLAHKHRFEKIYTLNEKYLETIDSGEKAQLLGILYSDGTLGSSNKLVSIRLRSDDTEYLEKINKNIGSDKPISISKGRKFISPLNKKTYMGNDTAILDITNKNFYNHCLNCGLIPRKTWANLGFPPSCILPKKFIKDFILGLFEGDGCITWCEKSRDFNIAGPEKMCADIKRFLEKVLGVFMRISKNSSINIVHCNRMSDIKKIYHFLYDDCAYFMKRKKEKFEKMVKIIESKGY